MLYKDQTSKKKNLDYVKTIQQKKKLQRNFIKKKYLRTSLNAKEEIPDDLTILYSKKMANKRIESSKKRLLDKNIEGRKYLEKEHYDYNRLIRLRNQLEKKKLQFKKNLSDYTNTKETDEDKIFE